jgi:hypothetical protein
VLVALVALVWVVVERELAEVARVWVQVLGALVLEEEALAVAQELAFRSS